MERLPARELPAWLERMLPFERYRIRVGAHRLHVMERGRGRPVLMLHGNPSWGFLYRKVATALDGEPLRVILPDLVGLGFSDKPHDPSEHRLDHHGAWIGGLIDALELEDVIFVGQDWGGPIGLCAFAERRERLGGLVVLNTVLGPPKPGFKPTAFHRFARMPILSDIAFRVFGLPERGMRFTQGDRSSIRGDVARAYTFPLRHMRDRIAPLALARMVPSSLDHATIPALGRCQSTVEAFAGPSAIVWGDRDPVLGRVRPRIERLLPDARVTVTRAGHFLQEEVPEEIADAVKHVAARAKAR